MFRPAAIVAVCLIAVLTLVAAAQQAPPGQTPVFRSSVDLVHLDVSVLDRDRLPVRGLTEADFTVLEDGKPQPISVFSAVDVPRPEPPVAKWMGSVPADIQSNEGVEDPVGRLFVLLLDDAMIPADPGALRNARDVAKRFIAKCTPADRIAVVFSVSGRNQTFTNDRARLMQAIDSLQSGNARHLRGWETAPDPATLPAAARGEAVTEAAVLVTGPPGPMSDPDVMFRSASMRTLSQVAETLISAPQRRKALVFVSPGIAVDAESAAVLTRQSSITRASMKDANQQLLKEMPELFLRMQRANVTIYPIDPFGAGGFEAYVLAAASSLNSLRPRAMPLNQDGMEAAYGLPLHYDWLNPGIHAPLPSDLSRHMSTLSLDFLATAAKNTGGLALINTNDFEAGLNRIFDENSSYYLLGYQQPSGSAPGTLHRLTVRVNRPDVIVRARSGYYIEDAPKPGKGGKLPPPMSPLDKAIVGAVPNGAFPMRVALAPIVVPGRKTPTVTIVLGMAQPPVSSRTMYTVDVQTNAYSPDGRPRVAGKRDVARVVLVPTARKDSARYDLLSEIDLPPGQYELRLSAHRGLDNVSGSLYADVDVPDFANAPVSVSGVMVEVVPTNATAPPGAFDAYLPIVPTSTREFRRDDEATAFVRIYQGGKAALRPASVTARLVNEDDVVLREVREQLGSDRFYVGGRAADYRFGIPISRLQPGAYLLTLDIVLGGQTITRSVQFTVVAK